MIVVYVAENHPWVYMSSVCDLHVSIGRFFGEWAWVGRVA